MSTESPLKIIIDYNHEIDNADAKNDTKRLSRISKNIDYDRYVIPQEDYTKLKDKVSQAISRIKYKDIFYTIRTNPKPEIWLKSINNSKNVKETDTKILNEIFRVTKIKIKDAFKHQQYEAVSKHISEIKKHINTKGANFKEILDAEITKDVGEFLKTISSPEDRETKIYFFRKLGLLTNEGEKTLLNSNRNYKINLIKTALLNYNFEEAKSYGKIKGYDYKTDEKIAIEKLKKQIRRNLTTDYTITEAIQNNLITPKEVSSLIAQGKEEDRTHTKEWATVSIIKTFLENATQFEDFAKIINSKNYEPHSFIFVINNYYQNAFSDSYWWSNYKDVITFTIADALIDGLLIPEDLDNIKLEVEKQRRLKTIYEARLHQEEERCRQKIETDRKIGIEPTDWDIIKDNKLIILSRSEDMSLSFSLSEYTLFSFRTIEDGFDNVYSEYGQIIHDLKYSHLSDNEAINKIKNTLIPKIIEDTDGLSLWNKDFIIAPIPYSKQRTLQPVYEIAKNLAEKKGKVYSENILQKNNSIEAKRNTEEYKDGVFVAKYNGDPTSILLIDDVYGTGRTIRACAKALKNNPNIKNIYYIGITKTRSGGLIGE